MLFCGGVTGFLKKIAEDAAQKQPPTCEATARQAAK
jgi:hypothetical protein